MILCARIRVLSYGALFRKSHKKKAENNPFQLCFTLLKRSLFCHLYAFNDFEVVKSIKIEQRLLKNGESHDAKTTDQKFCFPMNGYDSIYTVDLTSVVSNYKSL